MLKVCISKLQKFEVCITSHLPDDYFKSNIFGGQFVKLRHNTHVRYAK